MGGEGWGVAVSGEEGRLSFSDICATRDELIAPGFLSSQWPESNPTELIPHLLSIVRHMTQDMMENKRVLGLFYDGCGVRKVTAERLAIF